jgi:DNA modification methylase
MAEEARPTLSWKGKSVAFNPVPGRFRQLIEAPSTESRVTLVEGDNLVALSALRAQFEGQVTLAYFDPPFLTGREHFATGSGPGVKSAKSQKAAFDDRWDSLGDYLKAMGARISAARQLLGPSGSLVIHVDPKTSHYLKVLCDEIFGPECFASEVIWRYRRWPSKTKNFQRIHDVMLRYVKDAAAEPSFNQLYEALAPSTQKTWGDRKQRAVTDESGRRLRSSKTEEKSRGTPLGDVWEIGIVAPVARERTGYPTQKPEALLRRWIEACSDPGDLVLDAFMGSGTTLIAAHDLGRRCIGIDYGETSLEVTQARLKHKEIPYELRKVEVPLARATKRATESQAAAV